ncbi:hypothetical protein Q8F55_008039 [Vanrija albida]|uniref:non-specific serine/threonine protein kinase n=1 Tax=Vanrija albida TaxID=181172 RepID=A0ABR3PVB3_9TREE
MTHPPKTTDAMVPTDEPAPGSAELLDELLREAHALTSTAKGEGDASAVDVSRFRKLIEVLFNACVISPASRDAGQASQVGLEQAHLTLSILSRQAESHPELLLAFPPKDTAPQQPFYAWIITRILIAVAQYEDVAGAGALVQDLCDTAARILIVLARDMSDGDATTYMRGLRRVWRVLRELCAYARESLEQKPRPTLLGFSDMPTSADHLPALFALQLSLTLPFSNDAVLDVASILSSFGVQAAQLPPSRQVRYLSVVTDAVRVVRVSQVLSRASMAVAKLEESDDTHWQESFAGWLKAVEQHAEPALRRDVWWGLHSRVATFNLNTVYGREAINFLLTPIPDHVSQPAIVSLISSEILGRWRDQASFSGDATVRQKIGGVMHLPASTSLKRKREENPVERRVRDILRTKAPELNIEGDLLETLPNALSTLGPSISFKLLETTPELACALGQCSASHNPLPDNVASTWLSGWTEVGDDRTLLRALGVVLLHLDPATIQRQTWDQLMQIAWRGARSPDRRARLAACHLVSTAYRFLSQTNNPDGAKRTGKNVDRTGKIVDRIPELLKCNLHVQETATRLLGDVGRDATERDLGHILELLLERFGSDSSPVRSLAYTQLLDIAAHRNKQPYNLLSPYLSRISVIMAENLIPRPEVVAMTMSFLGLSRQAFFNLARKYVVPALVVKRNRAALEMLSSIFNDKLGLILIADGSAILAEIFLTPSATHQAMAFLGTLLNDLISSSSSSSATTLDKYIRASVVPLIVAVVIELGDEDPKRQAVATQALGAIQRMETAINSDAGDLGAFLKPHMLGVLAALTEQLVTPRTPADSRRKIIRSVGELIALVGDSMSSFSPQIIASLQSTLEVEELRLQTLNTWDTFINMLRFTDVGPFIGPTIAALVSMWPSFKPEEQKAATRIITRISYDASNLKPFLDDIVRFDHVPELKKLSRTLLGYRKDWSTRDYLDKLIERTNNKNVAIATNSMRELRDLLRDKYSDVVPLARGDTFDPIVGKVVRSLLGAVTRDAELDELHDLSFECFGLLGALDPDRFVALRDETSMPVKSNFNDHDESVQFALRLISDLLVGAFRSTNDTKHQRQLSYAIQELLKFCGFDKRIVNLNSSVPLKVRERWASLSKDVLETVTPLLDAQFQQSQDRNTLSTYPIYPQMKTYREWVQAWTVDLIGRVAKSGHNGDAQAIFKVFNSEPKNQDVAVAHHLLPHLVLYDLLSGDSKAPERIRKEIYDVLRDQVGAAPPISGRDDDGSARQAADKRMLASQVIFDLLDHLSKWLRQARADRTVRSSHLEPVEHLLSNIDTELAANAALKSRAYARSLRNFEERVVHLRNNEKRENKELQTYFESLHEIYAELDEPDGMEGVSAFVVSPTLELQIREHESTGRWTAAQSCWEVRLQQHPEDINLHLGLLKCLKNLGHYDTLRTHIRGVLSRNPSWEDQLAPFMAEAPWKLSHWEDVRKIQNPPPIAGVFLAMRFGGDVDNALTVARRRIGAGITTREYSRAYEAILQLHMLREVEMIHQADSALQAQPKDTAYSAALQAQDAEAPFAFIQQAKLVHENGNIVKALRELEHPVSTMIKLSESGNGVVDLTGSGDGRKTEEDFRRDRSLAKAALLEARWANEADRFDDNVVIRRFKKAIELGMTLESPRYHLGHYYDTLAESLRVAIEAGGQSVGRLHESMAAYNFHTCLHYFEALQCGVKYIYQTMPRLLTIWLDLGMKEKELKRQGVTDALIKINNLMEKARFEVQTYQFLTAFPQLISRITHPNETVQETLVKVVYRVIRDYPAQSLWTTIGAMQSNRKERREVTEKVLKRAVDGRRSELQTSINDARKLSSVLLRLAEDKPESTKVRDALISKKYTYVKAAFPSTMILPLQDALTATLPQPGSALKTHRPYPVQPVTIVDIYDKVEIMPSLQQPKKLIFIGSDGKRYPFLCKPHDDLRKDARLMDFNSMINKFLKSASESRRRHLYIRTYAVMPLNETCGLIEWVTNTNALKSLLEQGYARHKKRVYTGEIYNALDQARKTEKFEQELPKAFKDKVLPQYHPTVFHEWFLLNWPEPTAWLTSRTNYARTLAVMSMIGYVLGLGDRHGENILFDGLTGDTLHVDLNCLFDKAKTFEVPERVPFRLTHNMVDALGVTGVEGVFRKAAEITMDILRSNQGSLMSVLEAFVHDPLVEWTKSSRSKERDVQKQADKNLNPIKKKLRGVSLGDTEMTVPNQVEYLIKEATSIVNLSLMYVGWAPWL